jgi:hypothetical protein
MKTKVTINGVEYNLDLEKAQELGVLEKENKDVNLGKNFLINILMVMGIEGRQESVLLYTQKTN